MKIAMVTPGYAPTIGGVETVVTAASENLVAAGHEVEVWAPDRIIGATNARRRNGVLVRRFPATSSHRFPVSRALWSHIAQYGSSFDIVHGHSYHSAASLGVLRPSMQSRFVYSPYYHGTGHSFAANLLHIPYRSFGRRLVRRADRVIAISAAERQLFLEHFPFAADKTAVVHGGVDAAAIAGAPQWPDQPPTILSVGRLEAYKRVELVLQAFSRIEAPGQLVIVGDGPDRAQLEAATAQAGLTARVRFVGRVTDEDLRRWLRTARGLVSMSEHESFGLVGLEAVAGGGVAILSDIPAHREIAGLTEPGGIHIIPADIDVLAEQVRALLVAPEREPGRTRDWSAATQEYVQLYRTALDGQLVT